MSTLIFRARVPAAKALPQVSQAHQTTPPGRGCRRKTYIGNKARAKKADPEYAPKNRLVIASLFRAARCAWKPAWWSIVKNPMQDRVNHTHRTEVCPANEPNAADASITQFAAMAARRFAPGRPETRAKFVSRRGVVRAQFTKRSQRTARKTPSSVSGTCLFL